MNNTNPAMMDANPTVRIWPSFIAAMRVNMSRHTGGFTNGKRPSMTRARPTAMRIVEPTYFAPRPRFGALK